MLVPESVTVNGLKPAVALAGNPSTLKLTVPVPLVAVTMFVKATLLLASTDCDTGVVVIAKLVTRTLNVRVLVQVPSVVETVIAAEPVWPAAGVMVRVRLVPLPVMMRLALGTSAWFDEL